MSKSLSSRTENIAASLTVAIDTLAKQMIADGKDIVSLGAGEPDFFTPDFIKNQAIKAIEENKTRYTSPLGILELRRAISDKLKRENNLNYGENQIIVTSGAKHAIFNSLAALINPGDEVIIPAPYWVTYPELVKWLGGVPVFVTASKEDHFKIKAQALKAACTRKTKAILMNNPCNPTGAVYNKEELESLAKVIVDEDIYCISDEVYEYFCYENDFVSIGTFPGMEDRTIIVNGFSKSFCMTGWRVGYDAAPEPIAKIIGKIQGQATHHPSNIAQYGALAALQMDKMEVQKMAMAFRRRRDYMLGRMEKIVNEKVHAPEGAFYLFVPVSHLYNEKIKGSVELCSYLLENFNLAIVPEAAFGDDSCVRFSYAASDETLQKACDRFEVGIKSLR